MSCADPIVAALLGATVASLVVGGGLAGWRLSGRLLRMVSRRARADAVRGEADQGIR